MIRGFFMVLDSANGEKRRPSFIAYSWYDDEPDLQNRFKDGNGRLDIGGH